MKVQYVFLFGHYLKSCIRRQNFDHTKIVPAYISGFSLPRAFRTWSRICRSPSDLLVTCFFCVHWGQIQLLGCRVNVGPFEGPSPTTLPHEWQDIDPVTLTLTLMVNPHRTLDATDNQILAGWHPNVPMYF